MRRNEFPIVDKVRIQDMEYLLKRFDILARNQDATEEMVFGISLCAGITKEYMEGIKQNGNS